MYRPCGEEIHLNHVCPLWACLQRPTLWVACFTTSAWLCPQVTWEVFLRLVPLMPWAQAYKVWVGRFSCRCGTSLKKTSHVTWGQSRADVAKHATQRVERCKHAQSRQTWLRWISSPQTIFTFIYLTFDWWSIA